MIQICPLVLDEILVLRWMLITDIDAASGSEFFVFLQDSAPSHCAKDTVVLLEQESLDFIPPTFWSPYSPDLKLVDYSITLQERVYCTKIRILTN